MFDKRITAVFYGYHSTGKSTFLMSTIAATTQGKLKSDITNKSIQFIEDSEKNIHPKGESYFSKRETKSGFSRINRFLDGEVIDKTEPENQMNNSEFRGVYELFFDCHFSNASVKCRTIDYNGEFADLADVASDACKKIVQTLRQADCLYLVFDAELLSAHDKEQKKRANGQAMAMIQAFHRFLEHKPRGHIVILITKADLVADKNNNENSIIADIKGLNNNHELAKKWVISALKDQAIQLFDYRADIPIVFVAALGAKPKRTHTNGYGISPNNWQPIGVAEALEAGIGKFRCRICNLLEEPTIILPIAFVIFLTLLFVIFNYI